jgi:glycyl-tRNA synthetase beta chain
MVRAIARAIGQMLGGDVLAKQADTAARLAKTDLLTDMVGEFPELQGIMGGYYARHDGEDESVAQAIADQYLVRREETEAVTNIVSEVLQIADRMETLVGIWGIGLKPTGDKDPFGLRRQALGVLRILSERELPLDLIELLQLARLSFATGVVADSVAADLHGFMLERLRNYLREQGYTANQVSVVL